MTDVHTHRWLAWGWTAAACVILVSGILVLVVTSPLWIRGGAQQPEVLLDGIEQRWGLQLPDDPESLEATSLAGGSHGDGTTLVVARYESTASELVARTRVPTVVGTLTDCAPIDEALIGFPSREITCESDLLGVPTLQLTDGYDHLWVMWLEDRIVVIQATT